MPPTLKSSLEVEDALVKAADRLGMRVLFLRLVASELPDNPWLSDLETAQHGDATHAQATHLCGASCDASTTSCLTAFKIEDAVTKKLGRVVAIDRVLRDGRDRIHVVLRPVE